MVKYGVGIMMIMLFFVSCIEANKKESDEPNEPIDVQVQIEASKEEVEKIVVRFNNAMVSADSNQLNDLASDDLTYGHSSGLVQNKREFMDDALHGPFNFSMIENPDQSIQITNGTAIVRHVFKAKATNKGELFDIRIGNVQIYQEDKVGKWKLLARQAYKLPQKGSIH